MSKDDRILRLDSIDWEEIGDLVGSILVKIKQNRQIFEQQAKQRRITLEKLTAAAITEAVRQRIESSGA